jgi:predicted phosphodiesterase
MRIAIITDIHEDIFSLKEVLRKIEKLQVDEIVCLGDISGFCVPYYTYFNTRNAHECLSLVRSNCKIAVLGNHDIHAAGIIPDNCSFFNYPEDWYKLDYYQRHSLAKDTLWLYDDNELNPLYTRDDLNYLKSLPQYSILKCSGLNILFSHYFFPNISGLKKEFYTYHDEYSQHLKFMNAHNCTISFTGHLHTKGFYTVTKDNYKQYKYQKLLLNPVDTSIGLCPTTSQEKRNGFCIFDTNELSIQVIKL